MDKPTCFTTEYGTKYWRLNDRYHRSDGPAVERVDGYKAWWINGKRHRIDGPAIEMADGHKEWYLFGEQLDPIVHFLKVGELELDKS